MGREQPYFSIIIPTYGRPVQLAAGLDEQRRHPRSTAPVAHPVSH